MNSERISHTFVMFAFRQGRTPRTPPNTPNKHEHVCRPIAFDLNVSLRVGLIALYKLFFKFKRPLTC
ncbi:MAG: hypothetical protein JWP94_3199 [Mucilaginibacter sp.]|nr:hypothetical protein [Mucilaginibacter sp.]